MIWQDLVLSIGGIIFILALIPSIISENKPDVLTSISTGLVLCLFAITYLSLDLTFSAFTVSITAFMWYVLAIQQLRKEYAGQKT